MNYKLLWQIEMEENEKLTNKVKALEIANGIFKELLKDAEDEKEELLKTIERERSDRYENR